MKISIRILALAAVLAPILGLHGCRDGEGLVVENLYGGYWMPDSQQSGEFLLRFEASGEMSSYRYAYHAGEHLHYACPEGSAFGNGTYMVDVENGTLFINPDNWLHVILLTGSDLMMSDDEVRYVFKKYGDQQVRVVSREEFNNLFPQ